MGRAHFTVLITADTPTSTYPSELINLVKSKKWNPRKRRERTVDWACLISAGVQAGSFVALYNPMYCHFEGPDPTRANILYRSYAGHTLPSKRVTRLGSPGAEGGFDMLSCTNGRISIKHGNT